MKNILIATIKSWNIKNACFLKKAFKRKYCVHVFADRKCLTLGNLKKIDPELIFFPHWSWIIPDEVLDNYECVVFHMTDLPYGRGGSPLQNLILNKIKNTKISAIRADKGLDTGRIYLKKDLCISSGNADEILTKASEIVFFKMIPHILKNRPIPYEQKGKVVKFKRRTPEQSNVTTANLKRLKDLYDFIRMLDGEGYPKAYLKIANYKMLFSAVEKRRNKLIGKFEVMKNE